MLKKLFSPKGIKILVVCLAALFQLAVIVTVYLFLRPYIGRFNRIFIAFSIILVVYIIKSDKNPMYKIPWIVVLLVVPLFGWVIFLVYGHAHFGKKETRKSIQMLKECEDENLKHKNANEELYAENPEIYQQAEYLRIYANSPAFKNTQTVYFPLGDDMFPAFLEELSKAEKFIFLEYFIVEDGIMLDGVLNILEKKAQAGVDVRFMFDSFGSIMKLSNKIIQKIRSKGIRCVEFNTFRTIFDVRYNNRDHRKICVIDGKVGFTGGINIADEYINEKKIFGHWKDTAIMIKGEAVWSMTTQFIALWDAFTPDKDRYEDFDCKEAAPSSDGYVIPYTYYPLDEEDVAKNVYLNMINKAKRYLYIMTPYLILDNVMQDSLINAAKMGVDIRIMTPGIPDKKVTFMLTRSNYEPLLRNGVRIFEYTPGFVHGKIFVSDDETAVVGTINLDFRSLTHHFENAIWMYNTETIPVIKKDFLTCQEKCHEVGFEEAAKVSILKRLILPVLKLFSPLF